MDRRGTAQASVCTRLAQPRAQREGAGQAGRAEGQEQGRGGSRGEGAVTAGQTVSPRGAHWVHDRDGEGGPSLLEAILNPAGQGEFGDTLTSLAQGQLSTTGLRFLLHPMVTLGYLGLSFGQRPVAIRVQLWVALQLGHRDPVGTLHGKDRAPHQRPGGPRAPGDLAAPPCRVTPS